MKNIAVRLLCVIVILVGGQIRAQVIVEDPVSIAQDAMNQVMNLGQYVEMVSNQVQQITTMTQQLEQIQAYTKAVGDPAQILNVSGAGDLAASLRQQNIGKGIAELQSAASGTDSIAYDGNGLYQSIEPIRIGGVELQRNTNLYRKYGAVENAAANYSETYNAAEQRSQEMRQSLARTTEALQSASSDAETQKLQGVIAAQAAQLEELKGQVSTAASNVLVQDAQNRNDAEKQEQARIEADSAEWGRANSDFDAVLQLPKRGTK